MISKKLSIYSQIEGNLFYLIDTCKIKTGIADFTFSDDSFEIFRAYIAPEG